MSEYDPLDDEMYIRDELLALRNYRALSLANDAIAEKVADDCYKTADTKLTNLLAYRRERGIT